MSNRSANFESGASLLRKLQASLYYHRKDNREKLPRYYQVGPSYRFRWFNHLRLKSRQNPDMTTATRSDMGATLTDSSKWHGGVLGPDGKIYGVPRDSTDILIIDPVSGTATRSDMGATLTDSGKWAGGVLGPDGKIYGVPLNSTDILIIDPVSVTRNYGKQMLLSPFLNKY